MSNGFTATKNLNNKGRWIAAFACSTEDLALRLRHFSMPI
jgi:hypothetical protein